MTAPAQDALFTVEAEPAEPVSGVPAGRFGPAQAGRLEAALKVHQTSRRRRAGGRLERYGEAPDRSRGCSSLRG